MYFAHLCVIAVLLGSSTAHRTLQGSAWVRGGSAVSEEELYDLRCEKTVRAILRDSQGKIDEYAVEIESGTCISAFGEKSDALLNEALAAFSTRAPSPGDDESLAAIFDSKIEELEKAIDAPLHVLFMKQLSLLRDKVMNRHKKYLNSVTKATTNENEVVDAMDELFSKGAQTSVRPLSEWDFGTERSSLKTTLEAMTKSKKRLVDLEQLAATDEQNVYQIIQAQQSQIQQLSQVAYGMASPWNTDITYNVPDTSVNLLVGHKQGRTTMALTCDPDHSAPLLGANGFTRSFLPGNVGFEMNLSC